MAIDSFRLQAAEERFRNRVTARPQVHPTIASAAHAGKAYPQVQALFRYAQSLGLIHYPVTMLGHLLYRIRMEFCWVFDSLHDQLYISIPTLAGV